MSQDVLTLHREKLNGFCKDRLTGCGSKRMYLHVTLCVVMPLFCGLASFVQSVLSTDANSRKYLKPLALFSALHRVGYVVADNLLSRQIPSELAT